MIHAAGDCKEAIQNLSPQIPKNQVAGTGLVVALSLIQRTNDLEIQNPT